MDSRKIIEEKDDQNHSTEVGESPVPSSSSGGNETGGYEDVSRGTLQCMSHGSVSVCGKRREMEDAVTVVPNLLPSSNHGLGDGKAGVLKYDFLGVYDGHGGSDVANLCSELLHNILVDEIGTSNLDEVDWENVMVSCFSKMDGEISGKEVENEGIKSIGSTAVVALISKDKTIVANCGDCRAVLSRDGSPMPLSHDHKPDRADETERIESAGGTVINWNGFRVLGVLATSRSIEYHFLKNVLILLSSTGGSRGFIVTNPGDRYLKPYVISVPEVTITSRTESDEFVILASDGLWDVMSNEMACKITRRCLEGRAPSRFSSSSPLNHTSNAALAAAVLAEIALARGSKDNISVVIVELKKLIK